MSMAPFWPVEVDSMVAHTTDLGPEELGAYLLLMMAQWRNNGRPLPDDDVKLARISRLPVRRWKQNVRPTIEPLFDINDGTWSQKRVAKDFEKVAKKIRINRENAARGGKAKALKDRKRTLATAENSACTSEDGGKSENSANRSTKDESEGRRIPPPLKRGGGNPSSEHQDDVQCELAMPSGSDGYEGLHEEAPLKGSINGTDQANSGPSFSGRRPSDAETDAWKQALHDLRSRSESRDYKHLQELELIAIDGNTATFSAPDPLTCERASELGGRIRDALQDSGLAIGTVRIAASNVIAKPS